MPDPAPGNGSDRHAGALPSTRAASATGLGGFVVDSCLINRYTPGSKWGGPSRLVYHGVAPLAEAEDPLTGRRRINLTFRKAL